MKNKLIRLTIFIVAVGMFSTIDGMSQVKFKVLAIRGSVQVSGNDARIGQAIKANEKISVGKGAYVSLAHVNGRVVEIKKDGSYKISELDKKASGKTKTSTSKFASYVVSELTEVKEPVSFTDDRRSKMKTTGAVERAVGDDVSLVDSVLAVVGGPGELRALAVVENSALKSGQHMVVITPRNTRLLSDSVTFIWHGAPQVSSYKIVVTNRSNTVVYTTVVSDTLYTTSISSLKIEPASLYSWRVESASDAAMHSDDFSLWYITGEERQSAEATLAEINDDISEGDQAIGQLIVGAACEEMGLMADAHRAYARAVALAPDVQNYKWMYADFLQRQGLNLDAYLAYR